MKRLSLLCLSCLCAMGAMAYSFEEDGIYYDITSESEKTVAVAWGGETRYTGTDSYTGDMEIPATVLHDGVDYTVTGIGSYAFAYCKITTITLPETITTVADRAFYYADTLTEFTFPEQVTAIQMYTFYYCTSLQSVTLNENITSIAASAFYRCTALPTITIPDSVTSIGESAFSYCSSLTSISLGTGVRTISSHAFESSGIETITIPDKVTTINSYTFYYCSALKEIDFGAGVTSIYERAFWGCASLSEVVVPDKVTTFSKEVFYNCSSLTSATLGSGITEIPDYAFYNCSSLREVNISDAVTSFGNYSFNGCSSLESLAFPAVLTAIGVRCFYNCSSLPEATLPAGITKIEQYSFYNCASLTAVDIQGAITSIGDYAFAGCSSIEAMSIPESVSSLGAYAFRGCSSMTSVNIPEAITTIGKYTFYECSSLTDITLPANISSIDDRAFQYCSQLEIVCSENPTPPSCGTYVFSGIASESILFVPKGAVSVYSSTSTWRDFTFILEEGTPIVTTLEATDVTSNAATLNGAVRVLPTTDEVVGQGFEYWIYVMKGDTDIMDISAVGDTMSVEVTNLAPATIYFYRAYATTANGTFYGYEMMFTTAEANSDFFVDGIYYNYGEEAGTCVVTYRDEEYNTYAGEVAIPATVTYDNNDYTVVGISASAFRDCPALTQVSLPATIATIGNWAFYGCAALTEVEIPDATTSVGNQAFNECPALTTLTIGSGMETIGNNAFNCEALTAITSLRPVPPTCDQYAFRSVDKYACILYVPEGAVDTYAQADVWREFYNIRVIGATETGISSIATTNDTYATDYYTLGGQKLSAPQKGINIVRQTDGTTRKVYVR